MQRTSSKEIPKMRKSQLLAYNDTLDKNCEACKEEILPGDYYVISHHSEDATLDEYFHEDCQ